MVSPFTGKESEVSIDLGIYESIVIDGRNGGEGKMREVKWRKKKKRRREVKRKTECFGQMRGTVGGEEKI